MNSGLVKFLRAIIRPILILTPEEHWRSLTSLFHCVFFRRLKSCFTSGGPDFHRHILQVKAPWLWEAACEHLLSWYLRAAGFCQLALFELLIGTLYLKYWCNYLETRPCIRSKTDAAITHKHSAFLLYVRCPLKKSVRLDIMLLLFSPMSWFVTADLSAGWTSTDGKLFTHHRAQRASPWW